VVDIVAVVATVLGVAQTLGFRGRAVHLRTVRIGFGDWLYTSTADGEQTSSTLGIIFALVIIMGASTLSALSGVGKGIKWLSNINMGLSFFLLPSSCLRLHLLRRCRHLFVGIFDYLVSIPGNIFTVWAADGTETGDATAGWQGGWTIFYWAWWIAFAPFVGVFLARISKGPHDP
jgi:choline/glycine/proline betaine transport protein